MLARGLGHLRGGRGVDVSVRHIDRGGLSRERLNVGLEKIGVEGI